MSIPNTHIRAVLDGYLERFPKEVDAAGPLVRALDGGHELSSPKEFRVGHVTAGAVVLDPCWRVLMVREGEQGPWFLPGGHLTTEDGALDEASLGRLTESTGLAPERIEVTRAGSDAHALPLDLDVHRVPEDPDRGEPEHVHFTFLYLYRATAATVPARGGASDALAWRPHTDVPSARLAAKISQTLAASRAAAERV
ncbi:MULTISPECIES: NUDIX domain-containing protein [Nocardiopsis]|uniref:NUDIX domain-containing protein n=1 Tax=Nocardiopsis TaxID=2013 RepID=UPI00034C743D|nr:MULTISPECIES: NUDIX domain-containing protein [Nocardiopsis]PWV54944.1 ADP-ribose pyrophosphatase YjhB (NUDIX family) [Nocardiopsis sp. L17-MgMaSL7]